MTFQESRQQYIEQEKTISAERSRIRKAIHLKREQIERLEKKEARTWEDQAWWGDALIRPLLVEVKAAYPEFYFDDDRLTPMGIQCRVGVGVYDRPDFDDRTLDWSDRGLVAYLQFQPGNLEDGDLEYVTGKKRTNRHFSPNTIGDLNGMNDVTETVESVQQIIDCIERQRRQDERKAA